MTREPRRRASSGSIAPRAASSGTQLDPNWAKIGRRVAGEGGEQFLVRGDPGDLLDPDPDAGIEPLELRHELGKDLALAPHRPEAQCLAAVAGAAAAGEQGRRAGEERRAA